ncbi:MFS transporter [Tumebacillus sp. ITR2]|uniref:MFS transporter n=1 Tax=Tumebacillus amylolyticus TaxID=2801339 RepID=A0ABS1JDW2_9BACL|nr:MFS transporter [Tumebacillus amylolyticus]
MNKKSSKVALHSRPFRTYSYGNLVSYIGEWMDVVAMNWAVLQGTHSPIALGVINACRLVPVFLLSVPAGMLADRMDRRKLLIAVQTSMTLLTLVLGWLMREGFPFWMFAAVVTIRAGLSAMDPPIRNSLLPNLAPPEQLTSAIALNVSVANLSRIIGPAIAGALLTLLEPNTLFWLSASGFACEALVLSRVRPMYGQETAATAAKKHKAPLREALRFLKRAPDVQSLLLLAVVPMVFGFPYSSLMPLFARDLFALGPDGFGALLSASAVGALAGSLWLTMGGERKHPGRWLILSLLGFGLSLGLFMLVEDVWTAAGMMFFVGLTSQTYRTMSRITVQTQVPDHLRGRVMSLVLMDRGFIPLGALLIGVMAEQTTTLTAGLMMGAGCIAVTLLILAVRRQLWHV